MYLNISIKDTMPHNSEIYSHAKLNADLPLANSL